MRSTNMLERVNQEIKRRMGFIRIFRNKQACVRLVSTLIMELNQEWMERLYFRMEQAPTALAETVSEDGTAKDRDDSGQPIRKEIIPDARTLPPRSPNYRFRPKPRSSCSQ